MRIAAAVLLGLTLTASSAAPAMAASAKAILAGGCFWCVEHDLAKVPGVLNVVSGYSGGTSEEPTYDNYHDVDANNPVPHVEVVEVVYDPDKISYAKLLDTYFRRIDPTDGGGQFCDRGPAYRPVVFFGSEGEQTIATERKDAVAKLLKVPVAVDVLPAGEFWPAEEYHQDYAEKNSVKYNYYRWNCGRDQRVEAVWGGIAGAM
jgi:peptide-methionine (S)-S-oxide reductase